MNVKHLLYQINVHHLVSQMFFLDARNHALFSLTQRVTCHAYMTYIAADKVARVCTTNVTKTVNIVPSKESYFYSECQGLAYLHIAEFTS